MKKPKILGFNVKDADDADSFCVSYEIYKNKCFPAIPASEVERDYVRKADILKRIQKFPDELKEYLIITLGLKP